MKIRIFSFWICFFIFSNMFSQIVSIEDIKTVAVNFHNHATKKSISKSDIQQIKNNYYSGIICYYTVIFKDRGYVNIASTMKSCPILSYSPDAYFNQQYECPPYAMWMEHYKKQLYHLVLNDNDTSLNLEKTFNRWSDLLNDNFDNNKSVTTIEPLLTTEWGQIRSNDGICDGYNFLINNTTGSCSCPSHKCPTGCVAVAMAMVMKYWGHPIYDYGANYDFCNMPDLLLSSSQNYVIERYAISELMRFAGQQADMKYCKGGDCISSSRPSKIKNAMDSHFHQNLRWSIWWSDSKWKSYLRSDLNNGRPIIYSGGHLEIDDTYGHTFVCDGYGCGGDDNLFHFNWGWYGNYNDWFYIGSLNPNGNEFNFLNSALCEVYPKDPFDCLEVYDIKERIVAWILDWIYWHGYPPLIWPEPSVAYTPPLSGIIHTGSIDDGAPYYYTIWSGNDAIFRATTEVILKPGFTIEEGASLTIEFVDCPNDCNMF